MGEPRHPAPPLTGTAAAGVDGQVLAGGGRLAAYANFVKVAHTVFSLPFAFVGVAAASHVRPVTVRTVLLVIGMAGLFVLAAALLNPLCLALSPVALAWVSVYSYSKRFTSLSHLWLGVGMAIAPVGGYLAVTGTWSTPWWTIVLLALVVTCWGGGFDVIYSLQDEAFDREHGLRSMTVRLGPAGAIGVARALHAAAAAALVAFGSAAGFGGWYFGGVAVAIALLIWEHRLVRVGDYSRLDAAFFSMNGIISAAVMAGAVADVMLR